MTIINIHITVGQLGLFWFLIPIKISGTSAILQTTKHSQMSGRTLRIESLVVPDVPV
jgi:hypothetical protein